MTSDWVVLTAGILLLGTVLAISIMENSSGYLMDEFETLNEQYARDGVAVSELDPGAIPDNEAEKSFGN